MKKIRNPVKMIRGALQSIFKKPVTIFYPFQKLEMADKYRGKLAYSSEKCIGCKLCMRDCPTGAINIVKVGEKQFEAEIDLGKCIYCAQCVDVCPTKALQTTTEVELAQLDGNKLRVVFHAKPKESAEK